ncbi:DUF1559 domain-containing protein [Gemmata sp. JC673]|uniref:DUF1559 domain-containing protein n=1 Tax=Gemmata algarum TaxID=2975278 RepID=A0ABU5F925_9BACT|nr:DUF1559 domain-containing protein [Gemmata algarum]MDY3563704.1 DUF1559 domain-containing protein [Gemmata algarum]
MGIVALVLALLFSAIQKVRATAARAQCADQMRQIGLALHGYHDAHKLLPPGVTTERSKSKTPFLGWPAYLLPHIEQEALWSMTGTAFGKSSHFLDPAHAEVREHVIKAVLCPADGRVAGGHQFRNYGVAFTCYLGVEGKNQVARDGALYADSHVRFNEITDGLSGTLLLGERPPSANLRLGWWYAGWGQDKDGSAEMVLGTRERATHDTLVNCPAGAYRPGQLNQQCDALHFWSLHPGGANFVFADGSVRFLSYQAASVLDALATCAGSEAAHIPD